NAGCACGARHSFFSARINESAAANRSENERHGKSCAEHGGTQVAGGHFDRATRTKRNLFKSATVCAQRPFVFRAAVDVVEDDARKPTPGRAAQILDVQDARRL